MGRDYSDDATKTKMGGRVAAAKRDRIPREINPAWLNRDLPFNPQLRCGKAGRLLDQLLDGRRIYQRDKWERDCAIVVGNLVYAYGLRPRRPVSISQNANDWHAPARYEYPRYQTIELVNRMYNKGLIGMKKGVYTKQLKRKTRIWALAEFLELHPELQNGVEVRPPAELVELRDRNGRKLLDYEDTPFTRDCRNRLATANEVNHRAKITYYDGFERYDVRSYAKAVFVDDFSLYGRLHTSGCRHAQGLSKTERRTIKIDGQPIVELDYSGLQPRMLYAAEGIQYGDDPYTAVLNQLPGIYDDGSHPLRRYMKTVLLALLNASSLQQSEKAANFWLYEHPEENRYLRSLGVGRARPWLEAFQNKHERIAHYFGRDVGLKLMNKDARIALDVVWRFAEQGIPIIPVHDSFIVQDNHAEELWQVMDTTYQKHNDGFTCPIKGPWTYNPANRWKRH